MRIWLPLGTVAAACLAATFAATPALADAGLRAGAASADITPPIGTPMFAYTNRQAALEAAPSEFDPADPAGSIQGGAGKVSERAMQIVADPDTHLYAKSFVRSRGIHQRLKARAIVLERDGQKFALVQADLGGLPYALTNEVAKRVASTGITEERILLSATHTHSATGPIWPADNGGYAALGGDLFDPRIFELTVRGVTEAILKADGDLRAAQLGVGTVELRGASRNRQSDAFKLNTDLPADPAERELAKIDPHLSVVRVDDAAGRPMGVWSNFAVHATSFGDGNLLFSGDNPGYTEEIVERTLARKAGGREVVNVWTNGNEGDISPDGGPDRAGGEPLQHVTSSFGSAHMAGQRVARGVLAAWERAGTRMTTAPDLRARTTYLAFDGSEANGERVGPHAVLGAGVVTEGMCAPFEHMAGPGQGMKWPGLVGAGLVPNVHPISMWKIGPLGVAAFGSEITKQMGERIRRGLEADAGGAFERVALAGLTNSYFSYTATPEEYDACMYEGSFTLFGRQQGYRLLDVAKDVSRALLSNSAAPAGVAPPALGAGTTADTPPRRTPSAGTVLDQPGDVTRLGRAQLRWQGGDPSVDAPRGSDLVRLQLHSSKGWTTVRTDASFANTTQRLPGDQYVETMQFTECDPAGTYRFVVTGRADKGSGVVPYTLTSRSFDLRRVALTTTDPVVANGVATFRALYPSPGADALLALPRVVRDGEAMVRVGKRKHRVEPDPATGTFSVPAAAGETVRVVELRDGCGNSA